MNNYTKQNKGFTLIELIIVVAIIAVLAGVIATALGQSRASSRNAQRLTNVDQIAKALEVGVTGTTNRLPYTSNWVCLGKTSCYGGAFVNSATVDAIISTGLAGGQAPIDAFFSAGGYADVVLYNSNVTGGAYLSWIMEDKQDDPTDTCGRGTWNADTDVAVGSPSYQCYLRLGDAVTS